MKKVFIIFFILLLSTHAFSEEPLKAEKTKIGIVDLQRALNDSEAGKKAKTELEALIKEKQNLINEKRQAFEKAKDELDKKSLVLSKEAKKHKTEELAVMERNLEKLIGESNEEIQKKQRDREVGILKELEGIIEKLAVEEKFTVILPEDVILYADEHLNLTDRVIEMYNNLKKASPEKNK